KEAEDYAKRRGETVVRSVYRIPIEIRERPVSGALFDAGPFRRRIELGLDGETGPIHVVELAGSIDGEVQVLPRGEFRVNFTKFVRSKGSQERVLTLEGRDADMQLEIDTERTAPYLSVKMQPKATDPGKLPQWTLTVRVNENEAIGHFP